MRPSAVDPADLEAARAAGRRLLAAAERTQSEVRRRLELRGFAPETAAAVATELVGRGWLDEGRVVESVTRRASDRGYGRRRVVAELLQRGIDRLVAERAAADIGDDPGSAALAAARQLRSRYPTGQLDERDTRRLAAALQRRGFDAGDIRSALRRLRSDG